MPLAESFPLPDVPPLALLTAYEQEALDTVEAILSGDGQDPASGPNAWADCGEVQVPALLDALRRVHKLASAHVRTDDVKNILAMLDEMDAAKIRADKGMRDMHFTLDERLDFGRGWDQAAANRFEVLATAYRKLAGQP